MKRILNDIKKIVFKRRRHKELIQNFVFFGAGIFVLIIAISFIWVSSFKIPDFNSFNERKIIGSTKIYDKTGEVLLYDIHQDVKRTNIPFEEMSQHIKDTTIAIEDADFYNHKGVRVTSTIRAVLSNIFNVGIGGGGSTITQQLIKNTLLTSEKSIGRKIKEWVLAIKLEKEFSKEKILELYLNEAPYGGTIYGVEEASKEYFGKKAINLTLAEAAYLAAIPQSPTRLSPYGKNLAKLEERKNLVLFKMKDLGYITNELYEQTKNEKVVFTAKEIGGIKAPHFVFFIKEYLEEKYGVDVVEEGGLKVTTTLDYKLQEKGEKIVKEGALKNEKDWNGENASLVAIDPKTGQILTMVGSRDYFDKEIDGNYNIATALRQPGSSFKPFIYATAFNKGFTPETVLFDLPTEFQTTCNAYGKALPGHSQKDCYMPENYDGKTVGPISLRDALAQSRNIPAVKLFYLAGLRDSLKTAEDMGISSLKDIGRYGLTLVIGGGEVSLLDITSAYGVFADSGIRNKYTGILKVEDKNGNILEEYTQNEKEVLPKNTALTISDVLSKNENRIPTFGANSPLVVPGYEVAVKTGTTNNNKDAWIVGYSPTIVAGVWAGNNDNTPMKKGGAALAGPIWNKFMSEALRTLPKENFEKPNLGVDPRTTKPILRGSWMGNESFFIDKISGKLATANTPKETLQEKTITNVHTILYFINKNNITGPAPTNPEGDSQFNHWEIPIQNWWSQNAHKYGVTTWADMPQNTDDVHGEQSKPIVYITEPNTDTVYDINQKININLNSVGMFPLKKVDLFINGIFIDTINPPFIYSFTPNNLDNIKNENEIKIISYDVAYNSNETISVFKVNR
ncbi:MAG: transglycosylase domain-containing protein [Patescibacteria group bacterium]